MRAIDADKLKRKAQKCATEAWKMNLTARIETVLNQFIDWIDEAPTVEPERKKGKWIHGREVCREYMGITPITVQYDHWECSVCGYRTENEPIWNFCPECGAKMNGGGNG